MRKLVQLTDKDWYSFGEACNVLGLARGTVTRLRNTPEANFPKPLPLGIRDKRFHKVEIDAYKKYGARWIAMG